MTFGLHFFWPRWPGFRAAFRGALRGKTRGNRRETGATAWCRDPLSHPVLRGMSQRELGDLPFDPYSVAED